MRKRVKSFFKSPIDSDHPNKNSTAPTPFADGVAVLHECPDATVDICFVHGMTGNRESTWTARGQSTPWPKALLPTKLTQARILTYGYDAYIVRKSVAGSNGLEDHASNLLHDLTADRSTHGASSRALIFIAHSLGGLVCKRAILRSRNHHEVHLRDIFSCTKGIIFMGTPHRGTWMAHWADIPASALGLLKSTNKSLLKVLETDNQLLQTIQTDFGSMIQELRESGRPIQIRCFFEELPLAGIGEIVCKDSATLDDYSPMSIHANHSDMVKFSSVDDTGFKRLCAELVRWTSDISTPHIMDKRDHQCLRELWTIDPGDNKAYIEKTKGGLLEDSYIWIFKDPAFQRWYENRQDRLLWISGDPGKGKTMLLCGIINNLKRATPQPHTVFFFFCQATDSQANNATAVLRSLISQLIDQHPPLIIHLREKYDRQESNLFQHAYAWTALSDVFITMLKDKALQSAFLIVDALDECAAGLTQLLDLIIQASETHTNIKWIVSSRHTPGVEDYLNIATQKIILSLELNHKSISTAVDIYIRHKVQQLTKLKNYTRDTQDAVQDYLLSNANDTFLWVSLVCQNLARPNVRPHHTHLKMREKFPPGLNDLYWRMIDQINDSEDSKLCRRILAVICVVYRPIVLDELVSLIKLPDSILNDNYLEEIIKLCGSFLMLQDRVITFIHQSAKDFLTEIALKEIFPSGIHYEHHNIFSRSIKVINRTLRRDNYNLKDPWFPISRVKIPQPDPLAAVRYSCLYWVDHLFDFNSSRPPGEEVNSKDAELIDKFIKETYLHWLEALSLLRNISEGILSMSKLEGLFETRLNGSRLLNLISDANRFAQYHKFSIGSSPLQTYYSALIFGPVDNLLREHSASEKPKWVTIKSVMEDNWSACLQRFQIPNGSVNAITFSHDLKLLASASSDRTVMIWDSSNGKCRHILAGHSQPVRSTTFSHDSRLLASWGGSVKVWDVSSGTCLQTFDAQGHPCNLPEANSNHYQLPLTVGSHKIWIHSIKFSHDSKLIALASSDQMSGIWDMSGNTCLQALENHGKELSSATFSYDSRHFAVADFERVRIYDSNSGECLQTLNGGCGHFSSITLSHDFNLLASWSRELEVMDRKLQILDTNSGEYREIAMDKRDCIYLIAFSYNSKLLALVAEDRTTVKIWDIMRNKCLQILRGHSRDVISIGFSRDSRLLASVSQDGVVMIWDLSGDKYTPESLSKPPVWVVSTSLSVDSKLLAAAYNHQRIKIWDTSSGECLQTLRVHDSVKRMIFSPNSQLFASVFPNQEIRIWSIGNTECLTILESHNGYVSCAHFSHDSKLLATSSMKDKTVKIWDCSSGNCLWIVNDEWAHSVTISRDSRLIASSSLLDGQQIINIRDVQNGKFLWTITGMTDGVSLIIFSHDSTLLASVSFDTSMRIYNVTSRECLQILEGHTGPIISATFSPDSRLLASASVGGAVRIWNVSNGQCQQSWNIGLFVRSMLFDSTSSYLHTDIGTWGVLPASEVQPLTAESIRPQVQGCGIADSRQWITWNSERVLSIPSEYQLARSAVTALTVFILPGSGQVLLLKFDALRLSQSVGWS